MSRSSDRPAVATVPSAAERRGGRLWGLAAVLLGAFAVWAAWVIWDVRAHRAELERTVGWTGQVHALQSAVDELAAAADAPSASDLARAAGAIAALRPALGEMASDPELAADVAEIEPELDGLSRAIEARDVVAMREWSADVLGWARRVVPALRARSGAISGELAAAWIALQAVALASIALAVVVLALLGSTLRAAARLRAATTELAEAHARLAEAERSRTRARTLVEVARALESPIGQMDHSLSPLPGYLRAITHAVSMLRDALATRGGAERAHEIAALTELDVVLDDFPYAIDTVRSSAGRVRGVLDDLARWKEGARPSRTREDVGALVHTTIAGARRGLPAGVAVELALAESASAPIFASAIAQALHDVLRWVIEPLGAEGIVRVSLALRGGTSGSERVELVLEGTPARREGASVPPPPLVTPPALVLARWIVVERHGGSIEAASLTARSRRVVMSLPAGGSES